MKNNKEMMSNYAKEFHPHFRLFKKHKLYFVFHKEQKWRIRRTESEQKQKMKNR